MKWNTGAKDTFGRAARMWDGVAGRRALRNVAFLLGAGASVEAGFLTSAGLLDRFNAFVGERPLSPSAKELWRRVCVTEGAKDIEQPFVAISALRSRDRSLLAPYVDRWVNPIREMHFLEHASRELWMSINAFLRWELDWPSRSVAYLRPLVELSDSLDVFTLNYDMALELAAHQASIPYSTGFGYRRPTGYDAVRSWDHRAFKNSRLRIYKLHGSVRWSSTQFGRHLVETDLEAYENTVKTLRRNNWREDGYECAWEDEMPSFVFGIDQKLIASSPYAFMFGRLAEIIDTRRILVVIGYGWGDGHINQMLMNRMRSGLKVININAFPQTPLVEDQYNFYYQQLTSVASTTSNILLGGQYEIASWGESIAAGKYVVKKASGDLRSLIRELL